MLIQIYEVLKGKDNFRINQFIIYFTYQIYLMQIKQTQLKIQNKKLHICQIGTAYEQTYLARCAQELPQEYQMPATKIILHMKKDGQLIRQYTFKQDTGEFIMTQPEQLVLLLKKQGSILVIDLTKKSELSIPFKFMSTTPSLQSLFAFHDTKYVCIKEAEYKTNYVKLTYLRKIASGKPWVTRQFDKKDKSMAMGKQGNYHSLVFLFGKQALILHDIVIENGKGVSRVRNVKYPHQNMGFCTMNYSFWEIQEDELVIVPVENMFVESIEFMFQNIKTGAVRNLSTKCMKAGSTKQVIFLKNFFCFVCRDYNHNEYNDTNSLFIFKMNKLKIFFKGRIKFISGADFAVNDFDPSELVEKDEKNKTFYLRKRRPFQGKDMFMSFLLYLNEDFDDDLLQDALILLNSIK